MSSRNETKVRLADLNDENWREVIDLEVHPEQKNFVASNVFSLAEAYVRPHGREYRPMAIYHEDKVVGFAMLSWGSSSGGTRWINRFMIDREFQGQGFGRAAMVELLKRMESLAGCTQVNLCVAPDNIAAQQLYKSFDFKDTGLMEDDQKIFSLKLAREAAL